MKMTLNTINQVFYCWPHIKEITGGKSRSTVWRWTQAGQFPKAKQIGPNSVGWLKSEIDEWVSSREVASND